MFFQNVNFICDSSYKSLILYTVLPDLFWSSIFLCTNFTFKCNTQILLYICYTIFQLGFLKIWQIFLILHDFMLQLWPLSLVSENLKCCTIVSLFTFPSSNLCFYDLGKSLLNFGRLVLYFVKLRVFYRKKYFPV